MTDESPTSAPTPSVERRTFASEVHLRAAPEGSGSPGVLVGRAIAFNSQSRELNDWWYGGFTEVIDPRAFGEPTPDGGLDLSLHTRVIARTNHDSSYLLGTTDAEPATLRLLLGPDGVDYEIDLPDTTYGRDLEVSARRGDYRYSSFAFRILPDGDTWEYGENDQLIRRITSARLIDVAPVADPAYWATSTEMTRSFDLDAIRASLRSNQTAESDTAPDARVVVLGRARENEIAL